MRRVAILQCADTGPVESLALMLRTAGYQCHLPSGSLRYYLREMGCDTVLDVEGLVKGWGYDWPDADLFGVQARIADMDTCDLYVDVKGHRNGPRVWERWPRLKRRTLWYRINGGKMERVPGCGDEIDPPCPVLTPNQWYSEASCIAEADMAMLTRYGHRWAETEEHIEEWKAIRYPLWHGRAYVCWPPFHRFPEYDEPRISGVMPHNYSSPLCLIHNLAGWGYGTLVEPLQRLGVRMHGAGSPDGLLQHREVAVHLTKALAYVHLKSSDAPGYALYEALAAACPVICTRRLIWRCRMQDLLIPGQTCLVFDRETHEGLTERDVEECTREIASHLERLRCPEENQRLGQAGRERLQSLMWREDRDGPGLGEWLGRCFP